MRIKNKLLPLVVLGLFACLVAGKTGHTSSYSDTFTTGKDWVESMSREEKLISLIPPTLLFNHYGVRLRYSPDKYIPTIDRVLLNNPYLEKQDMANIFASTVYAYEPESRPALDVMERHLNRRQLNHFYEWLVPPLMLNTDPRDG